MNYTYEFQCNQQDVAHLLSRNPKYVAVSIPVTKIIDILTKQLNKSITDTSLDISIRAAMARGRAILNKYYSLTDDSIMYRMAMSK